MAKPRCAMVVAAFKAQIGLLFVFFWGGKDGRRSGELFRGLLGWISPDNEGGVFKLVLNATGQQTLSWLPFLIVTVIRFRQTCMHLVPEWPGGIRGWESGWRKDMERCQVLSKVCCEYWIVVVHGNPEQIPDIKITIYFLTVCNLQISCGSGTCGSMVKTGMMGDKQETKPTS